jgi:hypothetical protein
MAVVDQQVKKVPDDRYHRLHALGVEELSICMAVLVSP